MTSECYQLRRKFEVLIQDEKLKEFVMGTVGVTTPTERPSQQNKGIGLAVIATLGARDEPASSSMNIVKTIVGVP